MSLINELKRRNVFRVGIAYVLMGWVLLQGADFMLDLAGAPEWVIRVFFVAVVVGLPVALFFAWAFEMTPEGIKREHEVDRSRSITPRTGRTLDRMIIVFLALAVAVLLGERLLQEPEGVEQAASEPKSAVAEPTSQKSVAVLPFLALSSGPDDEYFADGLTEEILNSLAQLPELLVTARTSSFHFKGQNLPASEIAASLGVAHIVEGSVRRSGDRLRVTAQLIRANDGFHLWSENYDETTNDAIAVQEDIAEKIADALDIILDDESRDDMRRAGIRNVEAFINYQKGRDLYSAAHAGGEIVSKLEEANAYFDAALERAPEFSQAHLFHSDYYSHILLENVAGKRDENIKDEDVAEAMDRILEDFSAGARYASSPEQRANVDFDLALLSGNWQDMDQRLERLIEEDSCSSPLWIASLAAWYPAGERMVDRLTTFLACDPMGTTGLMNLLGSAVWSGDADLAVSKSQEALGTADHDWLGIWNVTALIMAGQLDEAETSVNFNIRSAYEKGTQAVVIAAVRGDAETARALAADWQREHGPSDYEGLIFAARMGDREAANRHAAAMDSRPMGYLNLLIATYWCVCGAPFDLEATPDFAGRLDGSGLVWPPRTLINWPLKEW